MSLRLRLRPSQCTSVAGGVGCGARKLNLLLFVHVGIAPFRWEGFEVKGGITTNPYYEPLIWTASLFI
jgi:hypothetical protein